VTAAKAPHQGYNHNVRHQGHVFHVQTEDSGGKNPHIETHVFYEGIIIASKRTPYADHLTDANPDAAVRRLMQEQHKALLKDLRGGALDDRIAEMLAKHKKKQPREETVPFGMKPLKDDGTPSTGDLPVAAPVDGRPRSVPTPAPAVRPPVAGPPVRRAEPPGTRQIGGAGVVVARPVRVVGAGPGTRPVAAHVTPGAVAAPAPRAPTPTPAAPPRAEAESAGAQLDALILRCLMEDLERGE
jgi:hypothetical protein